MPKEGVPIKLNTIERNLLIENTKPHMQYRFVQRARIILLVDEGYSNNEISVRVGLSFVFLHMAKQICQIWNCWIER